MSSVTMDSYPDHLYPLTSLQIGDIKANLSRAFLCFAPESHKFLILVDNQSWRKSEHSRSTFIKEFFMITYRTSPFRNTRPLFRSSSSSSHENKTERTFKWFPILNMAIWKEKLQFSLVNLHKALHGFIMFEVSWKDVRGIKYLNELQRDTSLALEVKFLTKWEFDGIDQALSSVSSWFSGTPSEAQTLRTNLIHLQEQVLSHSAQEITGSSNDPLLNDGSQHDELFSEDEFFDVKSSFDTKDTIYMDHQLEEKNVEADNQIGPMGYEDILLLCTSNEKDLPFELNQIITPDSKLLTLHESSLPSWAVFLQSYPLFCAIYRPWMRPLYRTIYILVSFVTVLIGFYDLYKNVPLLKATVSHLCGPLFGWIESWDMISRLKYLGTMLFIQNLGKAAKIFLSIMRVIKLIVSLVARTLMYPVKEMIDFLMPLWSFFAAIAKELYNTGSVMGEIFCSLVGNIFTVFIPPLKVLNSHLSSLATLFMPILSSLWELFIFPTKGCLLLANYVRALFYGIYEVLESCFGLAASSMSHQLTYFACLKPDSSKFSFWHSLWKDLFSKVFHSVRSIIRVLFAFMRSCNRHRLSIHNHLGATIRRRRNLLGFYSPKYSCHQDTESDSHDKVDAKERKD